MLKKTLVSMAVASTVTLTGCLDNADTGRNANPEYKISHPDFTGKTWPIFNPVTSALPVPNDLIFDSVASDGSFRVPGDMSNPVINALNDLSGASVSAAIDINTNGYIDPATVDGRAFIISAGPDGQPTVIPNPNQSVFLIELDYASGEPVTGLSKGEPPTIPLAVTAQKAAAGDPASGAALAGLAQNPAYEASVVELDGLSAIRINPLTPLNPRKRYVVAVTKDVKTVNGESIVASPGYSNLTDANAPLASGALAAVRSLINGLWEPIASNYFQLTNSVRVQTGQPTLSDADIVMSYSFTTSNDKAVLGYMAEPNTWFTDQIKTVLGTRTRDAVMAQSAAAGVSASYDSIKTAIDGTIATYPSAQFTTALAPLFDIPFPNGCGGLTGEQALSCTGVALSRNFEVPGLIEPPTSRETQFGTPTDVTRLSVITSSLVAPGEVMAVTGQITLPYYLGLPEGADGSNITAGKWRANASLAGALNNAFSALGVSFPQADPSVTDVVNYLFPFPQKTSDVTIPVLAIYPADANMNAGNLPVVIYQHGLQTDRSTALTFGSALAKAAGVAVIAIDHPAHGVAPSSTADRTELATRLLTLANLPTDEATVQAVVGETFHIAALLQTQEAGCPLNITNPADADQINNAMQIVLGGTCGVQAATSLGSALAMESTVKNAGSIVPGLPATDFERHFGFTAGPTGAPVPMNFDPANAVGGSGTLAINLTHFQNSRDYLRQSIMDNLNLRLSLSALDLNGGGADLNGDNVYFVGHSLGTITGIPFVALANSTTAADDNIVAAQMLTPGGKFSGLLEQSPTFAPPILGGLQAAAGIQQGDSSFATFTHVLQATLDSGEAIQFAGDLPGSKVILSEVIGDTYIPNSAYPTANFGNADPDPLTGTEPLVRISGATDITTSGALNVGVTRYTGGDHTTPVLPAPGDQNAARAFAEMIGQTTSMILTGGQQVMVNDPGIIQQ